MGVFADPAAIVDDEDAQKRGEWPAVFHLPSSDELFLQLRDRLILVCTHNDQIVHFGENQEPPNLRCSGM